MHLASRSRARFVGFSRTLASGCPLVPSSAAGRLAKAFLPFSLCGSAPIIGIRYNSILLHEEDARLIEEKYLKPITPPDKDPWEYNKHLFPKDFVGLKGDAHVDFSKFQSYEEILNSLLENMTYAHVTGHNWKITPPTEKNQPRYHWSDTSVFQFPQYILLKAEDGPNNERRVVEVTWSRRRVRCYSELPRYYKDTAIFQQQIMHDPSVASMRDKEYTRITSYGEHPISPRWLLALKSVRWPASATFRHSFAKRMPLGAKNIFYTREITEARTTYHRKRRLNLLPVGSGVDNVNPMEQFAVFYDGMATVRDIPTEGF